MHLLVFHWKPPQLSDDYARSLAQQISRLGVNHFLWQFRKACIGWGPLHPPRSFKLDYEPASPKPELRTLFQILGAITIPHEWICMAAFVLLCIGMVLYVGETSLAYYLLGPLIVFVAVYFGSLLWAFRKYRKWITGLVADAATMNTVER